MFRGQPVNSYTSTLYWRCTPQICRCAFEQDKTPVLHKNASQPNFPGITTTKRELQWDKSLPANRASPRTIVARERRANKRKGKKTAKNTRIGATLAKARRAIESRGSALACKTPACDPLTGKSRRREADVNELVGAARFRRGWIFSSRNLAALCGLAGLLFLQPRWRCCCDFGIYEMLDERSIVVESERSACRI